MTPDEVRIVMKEVLQEHLSTHCVASEQHYKDHEFVSSFRESAERVQTVACKTMTSTIIVGVIGFCLWAFRHWVGDLFGGGGK